MKIILNKKEVSAVWVGLRYYAYEATHDQENDNICPGLPNGEEKNLIDSVLNKLLRGCKILKHDTNCVENGMDENNLTMVSSKLRIAQEIGNNKEVKRLQHILKILKKEQKYND